MRPPTLPAFVCALLAVLLLSTTSASAAMPLEDYADYQPAAKCSPKAKPGTVELGRFIVKRYGGRFGSISRSCSKRTRVTSEHQEGRAFDWMVDASTKSGRETAQALLDDLFADDAEGNTDVKARRMGIMYVIWNDRMYSAWRGFEPEPYLSSSCKTKKKCSAALRHRNHVHISLTRAAAQGRTSWYVARQASAESS